MQIRDLSDAQCPHGIAIVGGRCIDCDRDYHVLCLDQAVRQVAYHSRRVAEMDVAIAERVI
jgi:hypothetical protein